MMLDSCGCHTSRWSQIYAGYPYFATTYQEVMEGSLVANFHLQDGLLYHLGHLCIPSSKCVKFIHESHYSQVVGNFSHGQDHGSVAKLLLLVETSTRCHQVYHIVHCMCHRQNYH